MANDVKIVRTDVANTGGRLFVILLSQHVVETFRAMQAGVGSLQGVLSTFSVEETL